MSNQFPKASSFLITEKGNVKVHSLIAPDEMFANATHIIELPNELVLIDGHFFAQYAAEFRALADSLNKPITRFYISHDHPDHFIGMGDAFSDVDVYALKSTKENIEQTGQQVLEERQQNFGPLIASKLNIPKFEVTLGTEIIDGVTFIFEEIRDAESPSALVIKLPEIGVYVAQDVIYNDTHMFITGDTQNWKNAINAVAATGYEIILAGHGHAVNQEETKKGIAYLNFVDEALKTSKTGEDYKAKILDAFPTYAAAGFIDIYLPFLF